MYQLNKILIIQTAFIGDVILATALIEQLHRHFPDSQIDFLLRKGNEGLLHDNPLVKQVIVWDKKNHKTLNLWRIVRQVRAGQYDLVVNLQRFLSSGLITAFSGSAHKIGFKKNPLSIFFTEKYPHIIGDGTHEVTRNLGLISNITDNKLIHPKIYLSEESIQKVKPFQRDPYITIAPTSVWFTKQFPSDKWIGFIRATQFKGPVYLLGAPGDHQACEYIRMSADRSQVSNLCGLLSLVESAALMKGARMNYVNDSAPQHLASAVDAPVCAVFCSTVPAFGFGPLSSQSHVVELKEPLPCRPCGLHGFRSCPEGHFNCARKIEASALEMVLYPE